jgi:hypothetical protein
VDRLLNVRHGSRLDQLEAAAEALGGTLDVQFVLCARPAPTATAARSPQPYVSDEAGRETARTVAGTRVRAVPRRAGVAKR